MTLMMDAAFLGSLTGASIDADAAAYIAAVEAADGQALEDPVKAAINELYVGIKADGDFALLRSVFCFAVPRTLSGLAVAMRGPNIASFSNFTVGDIQRGRGLLGNGTNKTATTNTNANSFGSTSSGLLIAHCFDTSSSGSMAQIGHGSVSSGARVALSRSVSSNIVGRIWSDAPALGPTLTILNTQSIASAVRFANDGIAVATHLPSLTRSNHSSTGATVTSGNLSLFNRSTGVDTCADRIAMLFIGSQSTTAAADRLVARSIEFTNSLRAFFGN